METDFIQLMTTKSEEGLQEYIDNRQKYNPQAVFAAIEEFKKRGRVFLDNEIETIKSDLLKQQEISKQRIADSEPSPTKWKKNVVDDVNAPQYYSEKAIYIFSILFSVLFGSILMTINLSKAKKKNAAISVFLFGIIFTGIQIWLLSLIPRNSGLTLITNVGGASIINYYFWKNYIGTDTKYRARPIWIPLLIALCITIPLFYIIIVFGQE